MSQLPGYRTGGTVHIVINNQIGFTTLPADSRSSLYCTDVAKMIDAPVFHVNGDDPEAVCFVGALAAEFRQEFKRDVIIDMYCYRRYGHNEGDEPSFTQPDLYAKIGKQPSVATLYRERLASEGRVTAEEAAAHPQGTTRRRAKRRSRRSRPAAEQQQQPGSKNRSPGRARCSSRRIRSRRWTRPSRPDVPGKDRPRRDARAGAASTSSTSCKRNLLDRRLKVFEAGGPYDWSFAETLAFGSLLLDGKPVRPERPGQPARDVLPAPERALRRGDRASVTSRSTTSPRGRRASACTTRPLSEAAVLGFDYGYSLDYPDMLCLWEAQFGDFVNGAQTIIDQFIVSSESKWQRPSGIVLLLPHGYEGQGPEHSSGRVERFLQSCAEDNIQVCNLTTPAQYFHVLRRQMMRPFLKPLVIMTPKSLLRAEAAVSYNDDFTKARLPGNPGERPPRPGAAKARRVIFCTGKVYYDLLKARDADKADDTAIIRIEQLYPLHTERLRTMLAPYAQGGKMGVVPGGIAEHGRVEFHRAAAGRTAAAGQEIRSTPGATPAPARRWARRRSTTASRSNSWPRRSVSDAFGMR